MPWRPPTTQYFLIKRGTEMSLYLKDFQIDSGFPMIYDKLNMHYFENIQYHTGRLLSKSLSV